MGDKSGYCTVSWSRRDRGAGDEPSPNTKAGLHLEGDAVYVVGLEGVLCYEVLPENQTINSNKRQSQLDQLQAALDEKPPEMASRKSIIFSLRITKSACFSDDQTKPVTALLGSLCWRLVIHPLYSPAIAPLDVHLFHLYKIFLMEKDFNSLEDCKRHLEQFWAQKIKSFGQMEL